MSTVKIVSDKCNLKKPEKFKNNIFTIYSPKKAIIQTAHTNTINTELILKLPEETKAFVVTKFTGQNIKEISGPKKKRIWITLLNEFYFEKYHINKGGIIGYLVIDPETINVQYECKKTPSRQEKKHPDNYLPKDRLKKWKKYWQTKKGTTSTDRWVSQSL